MVAIASKALIAALVILVALPRAFTLLSNPVVQETIAAAVLVFGALAAGIVLALHVADELRREYTGRM